MKEPNELSLYYSEYEKLEQIVHVNHCQNIELYYDMTTEHLLITEK